MADRKKILLPRSDIPNRAPTINEIDFGEIAVNTHDGKAFIKRQADGEVTIETIGSEQVDNVYYVSKSGDYGNDGRSLMNSFKSVDSAVAVVTAKQGFKFDEVTCERDLHLIMDAVRYDMVLNTNFNAVTAGLSYKRGNAIKVTNEQKYQTRRSINEERVGMLSNPLVVQSPTATARIGQAFTEIIDIFYNGEPDQLYFVDPPQQVQTDSNIAAQTIIDNRTAIQDAVLSFIASNNNYPMSYDAGKCARDVGYILDAVAYDLVLGTTHNTNTAGNSYLRNASAYVLSDQNYATIQAVNYARNLVKALVGVTSDTTVDSLFLIITQYIDGTTTSYVTPTYPTNVQSLYQTSDRTAAATDLQTNRTNIVNDLISWININYPVLDYSEASCRLDAGYIVDALTHDIKYGGNYATQVAGRAYFVGATSTLGAGEQTATLAAYEQLKTIVDTYVTTTPEQTRLDSLIEEIRTIISTGENGLAGLDGATAITPVDLTGLDSTEFDAIRAEIDDIKEKVIDFVNTTFVPEYPNFDQSLCYRDTGLIIDAVARDLALGTNYSTITAAYSYKRANSAYVISDQKEVTIAAVNFARNKVKALAGVTSDSVIDTLFDRITDVLEGRVIAYEIPSYPNTAGVSYQNANRVNAAIALIDNRSSLSGQLITWINENYPNLTYDSLKCERDAQYIIDALAHDVKYGGNTGAITNARAYFSKGVDQLGVGEQAATVAAYNEFKTIINSVVLTTSEQTDVATLLDIIIAVISAGNLDNLAAEVEPTFTGSSTESETIAIFDAKRSIKDQTLAYANDRYFNGAYDAAKCFRDVGLILDAVRRDLLINSDYWSITAGNSYLRANTAYVLSNQKQATIDAVTFARDQVKALAGVTNDAIVDSLFEKVIDVLDGTVTTVQETYNRPTNGTYAAARSAQHAALTDVTNRATLISALTTFINDNYPTLVYDSASCERDTGFLIDAIDVDLFYGGNTATRQAAFAYFVGVISQLGDGEETATVAAYNDLAINIKALTDVTEDSRVDELMSLVTGVISAGNVNSIPDEVEVSTAGLVTTEFDAIENNTLIIQNDVIDYINDSNPVGGFDDEKCARDTALIIDAVALDLQLNTNYNSITAGRSYLRQAAKKVNSEQLTYTIQAINYLRDQINNLGISAESQATVTLRVQEVTEILEQSTDYGKIDGDPINFGGSSSIDFDKRQAVSNLQSNRRKIQTRVITFIEDNYDTLAYDQESCERDVGYIIDALSHDVMFDLNYATETTARSYWVGIDLYGPDQNLDGNPDNYFKQLGLKETPATAAAYEAMKTIIADYVTTVSEKTKINSSIDVIKASIQAADPTAIPNTALTFSGDSLLISNDKSTLTEKTVGYANQIFPVYQFDQATCRRDLGYILDALTYDVKYGGNSATYIAQRAYFSIFNNGYIDRIGQNEINATIAAYTRLKSEIGEYILTLDAGIGTRINNLLDIIILAVTQSAAGTYQLGSFFNNPSTRNEIYQYNIPVGAPTLQFPDLISLGYKVITNDLYNAHTSFDLNTSQRLTIIRSSSAVAKNQGTDSTIFVKSGDYIINNPIKLPPKTSIIGDALRSVTFRPKNVDSDFFWADNGVYIKEVTFRDHQDGAACLAFDPRVDSPGAGPFITQSPYVQNCTSLTSSGLGLRIDGSKVSGLRSMVLDAFTQFNAGGTGVHLLNRGYAQLVSLFTVSTTTSVLATSGGQCSLTNSNSSFGDRGLVAQGGSKSLYNGTLHANYLQNDDTVRINTIITQDSADYTLNLGDYKKPNYNDAIRFDEDNYYYTILNVSDEITQDWGVTGNTFETESTATPAQNLNGQYGYSTTISKNDVYGVVTELNAGIASAGRAEVFTRDTIGGVPVWSYQSQLAPTPAFGSLSVTDNFGDGVEITKNGDFCVISAPGHKQTDATVTTSENGVLYTFRRVNETWSQEDVISLPGVTDRDRNFGKSFALSEDGLTLVSTTINDVTLNSQGAVYVYFYNTITSQWTTDPQRIPSPAGIGAQVTAVSVTLNKDGTDLLINWEGVSNQIFYYQRNIDNLFLLAQVIAPRSNYNGDRSGVIKMNSTASHFVFGDKNAPRGYFINLGTDENAAASEAIAKKQKLESPVFTNNSITVNPSVSPYQDSDTNFLLDFPVNTQVRIRGSASNDGVHTITDRTENTIEFSGSSFSAGADTDVELFVENVGVTEMFVFDEGSWITLDIIEAPTYAEEGFGFGSNVDIDELGLLIAAGNKPNTSSIDNEVSIIERARSDWRRVSVLKPQEDRGVDGFGSGGGAISLGGTGDFILAGAPQRRTLVGDPSTEFGARFFYYSIIDETGSYNVTVSPSLNINLSALQNASFHQRSLITASGHTFEYVGSGTNMFTAIPQNGGIPLKQNEIIFDSANTLTPNFGLVYFTATDELGDFRIGEDLTINREEGTITGVTFDRSLFAVLTPFILALEG